MILYVHTDLTGRYLYREADDSPLQPHLCRLAWLLADSDDGVLMERCELIKPARSWTFEADAVVAHHIDSSIAQAQGIPLIEAMSAIDPLLRNADTLSAFNWDHHARVLLRSYADLGQTDAQIPGIGDPRVACAMRRSANIVQAPRRAPGGGIKWPSMREAYKFFTDDEVPRLADARAQGIALVRCLRTIDRAIRARET